MEQKKPIRYSQKWARAVTFLSVVGVLLIPVGLLTEGVLQKVVIALLVAAFVVAWVLRVRYLPGLRQELRAADDAQGEDLRVPLLRHALSL